MKKTRQSLLYDTFEEQCPIILLTDITKRKESLN